MFGFDIAYLPFLLVSLAIAGWAQAKVHGAFSRYSRVPSRRGMRGAQVASLLLRESDVLDVDIEATRGQLSDHYDPRRKRLRLSEPVHASTSLAAVGVAAHEAGHAIQHARAYFPLQVRSAWAPLAAFGGNLSMVAILIGFLLAASGIVFGPKVIQAGIVLYSFVVAFTLVTLPVEFDASRRAIALLTRHGIVTAEEEGAVREVLKAAALTYVAAALGAILHFVYLLMRFGGAGGSEE
jgi:hypothetical protein